MILQTTKSAEKSIKKLDKSLRKRIINAIKRLPDGDIRKLKGYDETFRLRVGDYRVLYSFDGYSIMILDVLPRGEAYKRL